MKPTQASGTGEAGMLVRDVYERFRRGDIEGVLAVVAEDAHWSSTGNAALGIQGPGQGPTGALDYMERLGGLLEHSDLAIREVHEFGDVVVVLGHTEGVMRSTGKPVAGDWVHVFTIRDGRIARYLEFVDDALVHAAMQA